MFAANKETFFYELFNEMIANLDKGKKTKIKLRKPNKQQSIIELSKPQDTI